MSAFLSNPAAAEVLAVEQFVDLCIRPLEQALAQVESDLSPDAVPIRGDEYHQRVASALQRSQEICRIFEALNKHNASLVAEAKRIFLARTAPWFDQSWIAHRSRSKPSGFPGDFAMLIKLYEQTTPACGIGGYIDLCIQDLPLACAVRARMICAREFLLQAIAARSGEIRVLDIASGPCREFENWPNLENNQTVEVIAMDSDPLALEYVQTQVASKLPAETRLRPVRHNALRTRSAKATIGQFGQFDLLYSVGLCDYLTDEHLVSLLSAWRETLREGGVMYVAFKDTEEYDHTPYQWHLDWYFYQRTHGDVLALYQAAGFDTQAMEISRDETGIITNYVYHNKPTRIVRMDGSHASDTRHTESRLHASVFQEAATQEHSEQR